MSITIRKLMEDFKIKADAAGSTRVKTPEATATYAFVFEPKETPNGEMKYQMCMIFDKDKKAGLKPIVQAIANAMAKKFGGDSAKWPKVAKCPLRDGDEEREGKEYENAIFLNSGSKNMPGIIDTQRNPLTSNDEFYSGCRCRASLTFYAFDVSGNKGVGCGLNNVLKVDDGPRLDGQSSAEDDFEEFTKEAEVDDEDFS